MPKIIEKPFLQGIKKFFAELHNLIIKNDLAIEKLKEITEMTGSDREKKKIDELIARYINK